MPEDEKAKFKANGKEYEWKIDMKTLKLYLFSIIHSDFLLEQMEVLPELYKELFYVDSNLMVWMPSVVNRPSQGMVFAQGTNKHNWQWAAVKAIPMPEDANILFYKFHGFFYQT